MLEWQSLKWTFVHAIVFHPCWLVQIVIEGEVVREGVEECFEESFLKTEEDDLWQVSCEIKSLMKV